MPFVPSSFLLGQELLVASLLLVPFARVKNNILQILHPCSHIKILTRRRSCANGPWQHSHTSILQKAQNLPMGSPAKFVNICHVIHSFNLEILRGLEHGSIQCSSCTPAGPQSFNNGKSYPKCDRMRIAPSLPPAPCRSRRSCLSLRCLFGSIAKYRNKIAVQFQVILMSRRLLQKIKAVTEGFFRRRPSGRGRLCTKWDSGCHSRSQQEKG